MRDLLVDIHLRPSDSADTHLILDSWWRSAEDSPLGRLVGRGSWFSEYQTHLRERVLPRASVTCAVLPEEKDAVLGWVCNEGPMLHYVYVKPKWRKFGIAHHLVASVGPIDVCTHKPNTVRYPDGTVRKDPYPFNPFPLWR